ncbi:MAG TPA: 3,4-dihydroxy-2-butanone-4-phosphate synthase, partial [Gemmataceae bacterium]|nr:3,4-dihydroxy-2-butanone-4-phosphate synthase [Gemmataceae bacterium]
MSHHSAPGFSTIDEALEELRAGRMIVLVDDEHRENEGDLVMAAQAVTPQAINFIIRHACGRLCVPMSKAIADQLGLELLPGLELDP